MRICPNKRSKSWKDLVRRVGNESIAYNIFFLKDGDIEDITDEEIVSYLTPQEITPTISYKPIKPGVEELFDSNPELANVVYEVAGIRNPNITVLPNGNLKIVAFRTEKVGPTSKGEYQRGKGLYLSLDRPYPGEDVYTVEIEVSSKNLLDRKLGFGEISEDYFIDEKNKRVDKQLDTLHEFKQSLGIKAEIGSIDGALMNELVLFDKELINKALASKQVYNPQQKQQAQQLYSQYLDTIFPNSKVKDIVYHGTNAEFEDFFEDALNYFTISKDVAEKAGKYGNNVKYIKSVLLDIRRPFYEDYGNLSLNDYSELENQLNESNSDGYISLDERAFVPQTTEQIHILGSQKDVEGFKQFVSSPQRTPTISYKPIEKDLFEYNQDFEKISKVLSNLDVNKTLLDFITPSTIESTLQNAGFSDEMVTQLTDFYNSNRDLMYSAPNIYEVVNAYVSSKIPFGRTEIVKRADKELENKLLKWLEPLNISVKDLNDFKKNLNVNALGIADIINKTIYLAKERQIDTLPEEVAHFYVEFLEKRNKKGQSRNYLLYDDLINKIESWSEYQKYYDEYSKIYTKDGIVNIEKVKKEIIGKAIAEAVVRRFETKDLGLYSLIQEVIDYLRSIFKSRPLLNIQSLADDIAEKILSEDYSDIKKDLSEDVKLRDYKSVPKEVRDIIHNISSAGATMTGSVALRKAGTVYREDGEEFHDLDFKVSPTINRESFLNKIKKIYPSLTLKSEFQSGSSYTTLWNITVDGKIYDIDFFFETKPYNKLDNFVHWADTFAAKLDLGRSKDVTDFINYKPYKKFSLFPKKDVIIDDYLYYQTISYKPKPTNTISIVKQAQFRDSLKAGNKATFTYWSETTSKLVTEKDITITKVDYDRFEGMYEDGEERTFKYSNVIDDTISGNLNHKEQQIFKDNLKIGKVFENLKTDLGLISGEVTEIGTDSFKIGDIEIKYAEVYKEESQIRLLDRIQALKNSLSNQIVIFQSTMRTAAHKRRVDSLRKALEILENYDELVDLEEFFSEVSKNILTSKAYLISIAQKDLPTERKLALISYTKQFLDSFRYVEGLNNAIQNFEGCEKLKAVSKQLVADISDAKQEYFVVAQPAMAKILYEQFNPRTNEQLAELGMDPITEEDILKELNQPSKDLDLFNKFGVAPINSNDTLLGLFQKMIKNVKESARKMDEYFLRSLNPIVANLQKKYDIKKVMENFFTIEEVEVFKNGESQIIKVRKFIKQYNVDEFNNDMRLFYQERDSAYMDLAAAEEAGDGVARDIARGKILKVNEQINAYRQTNGKIIDAKTSKYLTEKYIAKDPIEFNNLLDRYYTPVEFEQTNQDSITYIDEDTGITTYYNYRNNRWGANRDKYITTKYSELQKYLDSDPDIRAFYDIIIENYKRANRSIPTSYRLNGILPSIYEKNFIKDTKKYVTNFLEENIPQYMARIDGKAHKEIPIGFTKLIDVSESSDDTLKSLMMFFAEANNYSTMNNFLGATENMVELLSVTNPLDENQKQRVTSDVNNRLSAVIKSIDQSVYNKQRDSNGPLSKFIDLLNQFTSLTRMALKPLNWAVNILRGNMENLFEGIGGRHYTVRDLVWANKEFIKLQSTNPRKLANMIRTLDAIQGRFLKEYGDEFVSFKEKYLKTDILFLGQDLGEIQIQGTSMLAMLRAWGIEIPADGNFDLDALPTDFINTLHAVNKRNHGVYNNFDRLYAQDNAIFRLFMQFRKYIAPTYRARFSGIFSGKYRIDQESGTPERGYYREFGEYVYKCMKNLNNLPAMLASFKSMPAVQKEGVRRTMAELIAFFTFYILVNLVKGGDDDEEDDEMSSVEWYTVYFAARLRGEIGAYLPVFGTKDQLRIINNPFAAAPVIRDMVDLFASVTDIDPDKDGNISIFKEYQRETGMYKKGELKILGKVSKLNPLDNVMETFYPEEMYDNFEAASKR